MFLIKENSITILTQMCCAQKNASILPCFAFWHHLLLQLICFSLTLLTIFYHFIYLGFLRTTSI